MTAPSAFGTPFPPSQRPPSLVSTLIVEPSLGYDTSHAAMNIGAGATPNSDNFIMREGRLEPRPKLSVLSDALGSANLNNYPLTGDHAIPNGGAEVVDISDVRYLAVLYGYSYSHWLTGVLYWMRSRAMQWNITEISASAPPASYPDTYDAAQIFWDVVGENALVLAPSTRAGLYAWVAGSNVVSKITNAPGAKAACAFDNYMLVGNVEDATDGTCVQRVAWCDRGSLSSWTGGLSGFEDLFAAKGSITRLLPLENRVAVFFEDEIWTGTPSDFPSTFRFAPFDATHGCPYPRTATITPRGIMYMARNYQLKLLPNEGGKSVDVGQPVHRSIRDSIAYAPRAFGAYDGVRNRYQFYYATSADSGGIPHRSVWLDLNTGAWEPQSFASAPSGSTTSFDIGLTHAFGANLTQSKLTSWDEETPTWDSETLSWNDFLGLGNERQTIVALASGGTVYEYRSEQTRDSRSSVTEGSQVVSFWESKLLGEEWPQQQKTIMRTAVDYVAPSASSLSVRALVGGAFNTGVRTSLVTSSTVTQAYADDYAPSRYAAIRVEASDQTNYQLDRFFVTMRVGGR